jgi:polyphosphate kinase
MERNLDRRIETLFPVEDPSIRERVINVILPVHLRDNAQSSLLGSDGEYVRPKLSEGVSRVDSQQWMIDNPRMVFADD